MKYRDPDQAFADAIQVRRLSDNPKAENYAGHFMYMGTKNGYDLFKNITTRKYLA